MMFFAILPDYKLDFKCDLCSKSFRQG